MKMIELGNKERIILLRCLDISPVHMNCGVCGDHVEVDKVSIMPSIKEARTQKIMATLLCDSVLCMAAYFTELEKETKT